MRQSAGRPFHFTRTFAEELHAVDLRRKAVLSARGAERPSPTSPLSEILTNLVAAPPDTALPEARTDPQWLQELVPCLERFHGRTLLAWEAAKDEYFQYRKEKEPGNAALEELQRELEQSSPNHDYEPDPAKWVIAEDSVSKQFAAELLVTLRWMQFSTLMLTAVRERANKGDVVKVEGLGRLAGECTKRIERISSALQFLSPTFRGRAHNVGVVSLCESNCILLDALADRFRKKGRSTPPRTGNEGPGASPEDMRPASAPELAAFMHIVGECETLFASNAHLCLIRWADDAIDVVDDLSDPTADRRGAFEEYRRMGFQRRTAQLWSASLERNLVGLALSGGGIRSATVGLGFLQGLSRMRLLPLIDHLSTVSGGGYIGGWLAAWIFREGAELKSGETPACADETVCGDVDALTRVEYQLDVRRRDQAIGKAASARHTSPTRLSIPPVVSSNEPDSIVHLREYSNFLTPRPGLASVDTWTSFGTYARNLLLNQFVLSPAFLAALLFILAIAGLYTACAVGSQMSADTHEKWVLDHLLTVDLVELQKKVSPNAADLWKLLIERSGGLFVGLACVFGSACVIAAGLSRVARQLVLNKYPFRSSKWLYHTVVIPATIFAVAATWSAYRVTSIDVPGGVDEAVWGHSVAAYLGSIGTFLKYVFLVMFAAPTLVAAIAAWRRIREQKGRAAAKLVGWKPLALWLLAGFLAMLFASQSIPPAIEHLATCQFSHRKFAVEQQRVAQVGSGVQAKTADTDPPSVRDIASRLFPSGPPGVVTLGPPLVLAMFSLTIAIMIGASSLAMNAYVREWWAALAGRLLLVAVGWGNVFGVVLYGPWIIFDPHGPLQSAASREWLAGLLGSTWVASTLAGLFAARSPKTGKPGSPSYMDYLARISPWAFLLGMTITGAWLAGMLLQIGAGTRGDGATAGVISTISFGGLPLAAPGGVIPPEGWWRVFYGEWWLAWVGGIVLALLSLAAGLLIDPNRFSLDELYAVRLVRCYLGASRRDCRQADPVTGMDARDDLLLHCLRTTAGYRYVGPIPLINTAMNLASDNNLAWQERKAEAFLLSPWYCGSESTGYRNTREYAGSLQLGRAMAISGAAVSSNMGFHTSPAVTALMTAFNVRLGRWLGNPRGPSWNKGSPSFGALYLFHELFGKTTRDANYVFLSDAGHFENLGVYELVRRRCRYVIVVDSGQDKAYRFEDLGNLIRKVRIDLGVRIDVNPEPIRPTGPNDRSSCHVVVGTIRYSDVSNVRGQTDSLDSRSNDLQDGMLIYIKPSLTGEEPSDVMEYEREHPSFPHDTTADQFFGESQFESYRTLGFHLATEVFAEAASHCDLNRDPDNARQVLFDRIKTLWYSPPPDFLPQYLASNSDYMRIRKELRSDSRLARLSYELLGLVPPNDLAADEPAERHMIAEMMTVLENMWYGLDLNRWLDHPLNAGFNATAGRWTRFADFRKFWTEDPNPLREEFSREFREFIDRLIEAAGRNGGEPDGHRHRASPRKRAKPDENGPKNA